MSADTRRLLDENIPASAVSTRDGGRGMRLSYLEGWYVIDRLNKILGQGNWGYSSELTPLFEVYNEDKLQWDTAYIAKVRLVVSFGGSPTEFVDVGYGDGRDNNRGKSHESATKESITDGIKRCAKNLGMSMGLALYDKTKEFVEPPNSPGAADVKTRRGRPPGRASRLESVDKAEERVLDTLPTQDRPALAELIRQAAGVILAKRLKTKEQLKEDLKTRFGVEKTEQLDTVKLSEAYQWLSAQLN